MQILASFGKSSFLSLYVQLLYMIAVTCIYAAVADQGPNDKDRTPVEHVSPTMGDESSSDPGLIPEDVSVLHNDVNGGPDQKSNVNHLHRAVQLYRRMFRQKRASHIEAVRKILGLNSESKQHKMLQAIFGKLFVVFKEAKIKLMEASFVPGDNYPFEDNVLDVFSMVLENTAFLGDLALRLPDVTHTLLDANTEWKSLTTWAIMFCNDSRILIDKDAEHLSLMAQELGIIEKHPSFVNPYKKETIVSQVVDTEVQRILSKEKLKLQKKEQREQKKKSKGPRMSAQRHTDL